MKWSLIHPQRRRLSAVVCKLEETESEGNYSFRDRLIMHYSLGRLCPLPILLNHLTVAHTGGLPGDSVLCHLYFCFSIMNDFLRVDYMILKEKEEEEKEETKQHIAWRRDLRSLLAVKLSLTSRCMSRIIMAGRYCEMPEKKTFSPAAEFYLVGDSIVPS